MRITNLPENVRALFSTHKSNLKLLGFKMDKVYFRYIRNSKRVPKGIVFSVVQNGVVKTFSSKTHKDDTFNKYEGFVVVLRKMLGLAPNTHAESIAKYVKETEAMASKYFDVYSPIVLGDNDEYRTVIDAIKKQVSEPKPKTKDDILKFINGIGNDQEVVPVIDGEVKSFIGIANIGGKPHAIYNYDLVVEHIMEMFSIDKAEAISIVEKSILEFNKADQNPVLVKTFK